MSISSGMELIGQAVAQQHAAADAVRQAPGRVPDNQITPEEMDQTRTGIVPPRLRGNVDTSTFTGNELIDFSTRGKLPDRIVFVTPATFQQERQAAELAMLEARYAATDNGKTMGSGELMQLATLRQHAK